MWRFAVGFFFIYGGMNAYVFLKFSRGLVTALAWRALLAAFLAVMTVGPVLVRALEARGLHAAAKALALVSNPWLAVAVWFVCLGLLLDAWNLLLKTAGYFAPWARGLIIPPRPVLIALSVTVAGALCWGLVEAAGIRRTDIALEAPQLPPGSRPIRMAVLADMHVGINCGWGRFDRAVRLMEQAEPDIIVSLGDLVDSAGGDLDAFADRLAELNPPLGKYAVFGNHEFYAGWGRSAEFHRRAGFRLVGGSIERIADGVWLAGVDDPAGERLGLRASDESTVLPAERAGFTILLKHRPEVSPEAAGRFDLQLSGHSHGGQFFPWTLITARQWRCYRGLHRLPEGGLIYTSCGAGTWGPPVRLLARPEVTIVTLTPPPRPH